MGRLASIIAPLLVPVLMGGGGIVTTFAVFAVSFALAAGAAFLLPENAMPVSTDTGRAWNQWTDGLVESVPEP